MEETTYNFLVWRDSYSLGNELLDEEHKRIFELANNIQVLNKENVNQDQLMKAFTFLIEFAEVHFEHEEEFMDQIGYEKRVEHKNMHKAIKTTLSSLLSVSLPFNERIDKLQELIKVWVVNHMIEDDSLIVK